MAHTELVEKIHKDLQQHRIPKKAVDEMVQEIFTYIENKLVKQKPFAVNSFGRWSTKTVKSKVGCHPQTHTAIMIPASQKIIFKPSSALTRKLK